MWKFLPLIGFWVVCYAITRLLPRDGIRPGG